MKRNNLLVAIFGVALLNQSSFAQTPAPRDIAPTILGPVDHNFAAKASEGGLAEVQEAQLAVSRGGSEKLKLVAQEMQTDHGAANAKLKTILDAKKVERTTQMSVSDKKEFDSLQKQSGDAFDRQYISGQISAHKQTIALFKTEVSSGADPELKQFASDTIPTLQHHLENLEGLNSNK